MSDKFKPICFFISPIGSDDSQQRKHSNDVMQLILEPALGNKYKIIRADQILKSGLITQQIITLLRDAHLVVADLTGLNHNVLYELAIRHCLQKPAIHLMRKGQPLPFDLHNNRAIEYPSDIAHPGINNTVGCVIAFAEAFERGEPVENPVTFAMENNVKDSVDLNQLKENLDVSNRRIIELESERNATIDRLNEQTGKSRLLLDQIAGFEHRLSQLKDQEVKDQNLYFIDNSFRDRGEPRYYPAYCVGCFRANHKRVELIEAPGGDPKIIERDGLCPVCKVIAQNAYRNGPPRT